MICNLCPRRCNTDRSTPAGRKRSICRATDDVEIALVSLHAWEEPCISGKNGAGTIFFSHCNLRCCFCQNYEISAGGKGLTVSTERLTEIFLEQAARGATCIELVTPGHYSRQIKEALIEAKARGLALPVVWNSNGYELPETLRTFEGLVDIFIPDLKYFDSRLGEKYSGVPHYFEFASAAIECMFDMVGPAVIGDDGLMKRGMIVRHLVLPWQWRDSCKCLDWLHGRFGDNIYISVMNQYMPIFKACRHPEINRPLTTLEYQKVVRHANEIGVKNGFMQVGKTNEEKFIPNFNGDHVLLKD
ncbi:radical SAM protein [Sutterella sp.]|uniref:radical SAM protein n=1 Tax=Sutterella sp. TaxID=1981025 RepID=UPI0026DFDBA7|nr:radical SAM protein [Sutterella sp.]MDO5531452.1 radical SAM protein [Sutterella sp.]